MDYGWSRAGVSMLLGWVIRRDLERVCACLRSEQWMPQATSHKRQVANAKGPKAETQKNNLTQNNKLHFEPSPPTFAPPLFSLVCKSADLAVLRVVLASALSESAVSFSESVRPVCQVFPAQCFHVLSVKVFSDSSKHHLGAAETLIAIRCILLPH